MASKGDINKGQIQPNLPERWALLPFKEGLEKTGTFTKLKSKEYLVEGLYPVIDQGEKFISGYVEDEKLIYQGELPVVIFGDHTRVVKYIDFEFAAGADGTKILKPFQAVDDKFFYYYLRALQIPSFGYSRHFKVFDSLDLPVPPLPEQQRIVAKLDALFGHLDTLRTKLDRIPELLKNFRQQVLTQAVTGKLTEQWREEKGLGKWTSDLLDNLSERITVGYVGKMADQYIESGVPFLRSQNVRAFKFDSKNLLYISPTFHKEIKKSALKPGDVVVVRSGYPGTTCVIPDSLQEANCSDILIMTTKKKELNPHFVSVFMNSDLGKSIVFQGKVGNAQQHFNTKTLKGTRIPLPDIDEQVEIVERVDELFEVATKIESQYHSIKAKIDNLPQAILNKAFKGELVEQDPSDEPANVLLERIKSKKELTKRAVKIKVPKSEMKKKAYPPKVLIPENMKIIEVLQESKQPLTPKEVWQSSEYKDDIDAFYNALKVEIENKKVKESSDKKYIELA